MMNLKIALYMALLFCALGWFVWILGFVFFPLSLFFLTRSNTTQLLFIILVTLNITGLTLSLFLIVHTITKQLL